MKWQSSARIIIALAVSLSTARVQIPLGGSSTAAVASLVESASSLPASVLTSLDRKLPSLPTDHLTRLQQHVDALKEPRRVQFEQDGHRFEISEGQKALLTLAGQRFVDVTADSSLEYTTPPAAVSDRYPTSFKHSKKELESSIYKHINIEETKKFLREFTEFYTRYYRSPTGKQSQQMLQRTLEDICKAYGSKVNVTIREFPHSWGQNTIIARFEPTAEAKHGDAPIVLLSAHQDSTNSLPFLRAPGADDDGAGVGVLVSVFTALLKSGYAPTSSALELHFYSAEEGGLLGSGEVSKAYIDRGATIRSVYHMDVVAFHKKGTEERIGVISDNVDEDLTNLMRRLVREFADIDYVDTKCGYGCSDHASWAKLGAPAACLAEGRFEDTNPNMHSAGDTIDAEGFSFAHVHQFIKVAIAYAMEVAEMKLA